jgi:effector-binding domain-containing protein
MRDYQIIDCGCRPTAVIRGQVRLAHLPGFLAHSLPLVLRAMEVQGSIPGGEPFAYYHSVPNGTVDVEAGFPVVGSFVPSGDVTSGRLPGGHVITGLHIGPYETIVETYAEMIAWAQTQGLQPTGDMWEVYLTDPERESDPAKWRTGLFVRVRSAGSDV